MEPKPGWTRTNERGRWYFRNANPLSTADAKKKFADARAAGIEELKTFANTRMNISRSPTRVRLQFNGKFRETTIPEFLTEGEQDNIGSENHRRFLAVEKINGDFDTNALDEESH
ncbi:MAG: hypothetical protein HY288_16270 [Planctomycetia bacterium]|nr:hypothetical protein [Planctomycetia bacterium]